MRGEPQWGPQVGASSELSRPNRRLMVALTTSDLLHLSWAEQEYGAAASW
jgi:hypothetical protein